MRPIIENLVTPLEVLPVTFDVRPLFVLYNVDSFNEFHKGIFLCGVCRQRECHQELKLVRRLRRPPEQFCT